jgi:hypothetical protein
VLGAWFGTLAPCRRRSGHLRRTAIRLVSEGRSQGEAVRIVGLHRQAVAAGSRPIARAATGRWLHVGVGALAGTPSSPPTLGSAYGSIDVGHVLAGTFKTWLGPRRPPEGRCDGAKRSSTPRPTPRRTAGRADSGPRGPHPPDCRGRERSHANRPAQELLLHPLRATRCLSTPPNCSAPRPARVAAVAMDVLDGAVVAVDELFGPTPSPGLNPEKHLPGGHSLVRRLPSRPVIAPRLRGRPGPFGALILGRQGARVALGLGVQPASATSLGLGCASG